MSQAAIDDVLHGHRPYDSLGDYDQAVVRAIWSDGVSDAAAGLDLTGELKGTGRSWSELDGAGNVAHRNIGG